MAFPELPLTYSYLSLPQAFYHKQSPEASFAPELVAWNQALSEQMNLPLRHWTQDERTQFLGGQILQKGIHPFAQAYAGHQFGHFAMLGDGRALMLGEWKTPEGTLLDLQWKGSGKTPFSRRGDGKATLASMLREYLISEAMHALGIPTTRSLAVLTTGEKIQRETELPGAMLVRVAKAHIRIGTFEWARNLRPEEDLPVLFHYTAQRLCPKALATENPALYLFEKVMDQHLDLVAQWMRVGFIHGVMNTDNMSLAGETIDYGPCAFMNRYHPQTVYSYIDEDGRYAFGNQPNILRWNFGVLAGAMLPLFHKDVAIARDMVLAVLETFPGKWKKVWEKMMAEKLGLPDGALENEALIADLLHWMEHSRADYTKTFRDLSEDIAIPGLSKDWVNRWKSMRLPDALVRMKAVNPMHIPRNHWIEEALQEANAGQWDTWQALLDIVQHPYDHTRTYPKAIWPETDWQEGFHTFCGT
jgi:uncharacterized protein YdiU (UPF0061 family)